MKKIAYIELDTHTEIAGNFMELMNGSDEFSVDYYFSRKILKQIGSKDSNIFVTESSDIFNQLKNKNYDLVIIGTVHRYFDVFLKITQHFNTSVIVHNLNFTTISRFQLFRNIFKKDFKYRLKLLLKEGLLSAPQVFRNAKNLLVLDDGLVKEDSDFKINFLPVFYLSEYEKQHHPVITIVVPGAVSQKRRNYKKVLNALKNVQRKSDYQVVFLGKACGEELSWIKNFEEQKSEHISVTYFTKKVPQSIFDKWMQKADILWCPLQEETEFFSQKEFYGLTKMSGNVGDAIKYGKLAIFPQNYPNSHRFIIPEDENIEEQISALPRLRISDFEGNFNKEKVLKSLEQTLSQLL